jgi:hypothetical protein
MPILSDFWQVYKQVFSNGVVWAWLIATGLDGAFSLFANGFSRFKPKWEARMGKLKALPFVIFIVLFLLTISIVMPYNVWRIDQNILKETGDKVDAIQKQLEDLQSKKPIPLSVTSGNGIITTYSPTQSTITITAKAKPPYSHVLPQTISNDNAKFYIYQVLLFKASDGFKFAQIKDIDKLPSNFIVQPGYEDTDNVTLIVKELPPFDHEILPLEVYTFDKSKEGTEVITVESLAVGIEKTLE